MEFKAWPKIVRLENKRTPVFTEKIDGTNGCIYIGEDGEFGVQSRIRVITPEDDNYGFAKWAYAHRDELEFLGKGYHFGEWWGAGIQRNYGLTEKRFSLFNTRRWGEHNPPPPCCHVVPMIFVNTAEEACDWLRSRGSLAVPGWPRPEGVVMYEPDTNTMFKIIMDK